jgi:hypothetical protein
MNTINLCYVTSSESSVIAAFVFIVADASIIMINIQNWTVNVGGCVTVMYS